MKKWIAVFLALVTVFTLWGCRRKNTDDPQASAPTGNTQTTPTNTASSPGSALELLQTVWDSYGEEEKFSVMGGSYDEDESKNQSVNGAPGAYDLSNAGITTALLVPNDRLSSVAQAASLMHGMLANNFTCGAFRITADPEGFAKAVQENIAQNNWLCGAPERSLVVVIGKEYVVAGFGAEDIMQTWKDKLTGAYPDCSIIADKAIIS